MTSKNQLKNLSEEYIKDYTAFHNEPNMYNTEIVKNWIEDFAKINNDEKEIMYIDIYNNVKLCDKKENYKKAAMIKDALNILDYKEAQHKNRKD